MISNIVTDIIWAVVRENTHSTHMAQFPENDSKILSDKNI